MKKSKVHWCVIDAKDQVFRCQRCKDTYPLSAVVGQPVDFFLSASRTFMKLHKNCKEPA